MSRIAKVPIILPDGVQASVSPDMVVALKGPKGELKVDTRANVEVLCDDGKIVVKRKSDQKQDKAFHGLYYRLITSAITGITQGYKKELELQGVGYRADMNQGELVLRLGFSHSIRYRPDQDVTVEAPETTKIVITGIDKQKVHQSAAEIRAIKPPEPYKGKGIRYLGEAVRRKVGKTGVK